MPRTVQTTEQKLRKIQENISKDALPFLRDGNMEKLEPYASAIGHVEDALRALKRSEGPTAQPKK